MHKPPLHIRFLSDKVKGAQHLFWRQNQSECMKENEKSAVTPNATLQDPEGPGDDALKLSHNNSKRDRHHTETVLSRNSLFPSTFFPCRQTELCHIKDYYRVPFCSNVNAN